MGIMEKLKNERKQVSSCLDEQKADTARENLVRDTVFAQELGAQIFT